MARRDGDIEAQAGAFRRAQESDRDLRTSVGQLLCSAGVPSIQWLFYFDFARRLSRLSRSDMSGDVRVSEARMQLEVWVARGLNRTVLEEIAFTLFNLTLTGPIPTLAADKDAVKA
jgi:hypothetical protein